MMITQDQLRNELAYDPETGVFTRLIARPRQPLGAVAGTLDESGRVRICVNGKIYRAHRLAWLYIYGVMPVGDLDHIDGNPSNNAISNLRVGSRAQNMQNQRHARSDCVSGLLGVSVRGAKFRAEIRAGGRRLNLGTFCSAEEAHSVYLAAKRQLHEFCSI